MLATDKRVNVIAFTVWVLFCKVSVRKGLTVPLWLLIELDLKEKRAMKNRHGEGKPMILFFYVLRSGVHLDDCEVIEVSDSMRSAQ